MGPKFLVPDNTTLAASALGAERLVDGPTQRARIFVRESTRGGPAPRKTFFAEGMLENSATKPRRRLGDFVVSATVQLLLLATLLLLPLYFTQAIDVHLFNKTLLVGQGVKAPRLILGPQPVYPILARQARISGAVVIDAVIDTQGNIVEMRTVSGHPILALAAMEALRHWKYEPTILGGEAIPVELLVTLTFVPNRAQS